MVETVITPKWKKTVITTYDTLGRVLSAIDKGALGEEKYYLYKENATIIKKKNMPLMVDSASCVKRKDTTGKEQMLYLTQNKFTEKYVFITNRRNHLTKIIRNNDTISNIITYNKRGYAININYRYDHYAEVNDTISHIVKAKLRRTWTGIRYYYYGDSSHIKQTEVYKEQDSLITTEYLNKTGMPVSRLVERFNGKFLFERSLGVLNYYYYFDKIKHAYNYEMPLRKTNVCNNLIAEYKYNAKDLLIYHRTGSIEYFYEYEYFD